MVKPYEFAFILPTEERFAGRGRYHRESLARSRFRAPAKSAAYLRFNVIKTDNRRHGAFLTARIASLPL